MKMCGNLRHDDRTASIVRSEKSGFCALLCFLPPPIVNIDIERALEAYHADELSALLTNVYRQSSVTYYDNILLICPCSKYSNKSYLDSSPLF
jgi:hypothetical protein